MIVKWLGNLLLNKKKKKTMHSFCPTYKVNKQIHVTSIFITYVDLFLISRKLKLENY